MDKLLHDAHIFARQRASRYLLTTRCLHLHPYFVERIRPNPVKYQLRVDISAPHGLQKHMTWTDDLECKWEASWHRSGNVTSGVSISSTDAGCEASIDQNTRWFVGVKTDCTFMIVTPKQQTTARLHGGFLGSKHVLEISGRIVSVGLGRRVRCGYPIVVRRRCPVDERICVAIFVALLHWPFPLTSN